MEEHHITENGMTIIVVGSLEEYYKLKERTKKEQEQVKYNQEQYNKNPINNKSKQSYESNEYKKICKESPGKVACSVILEDGRCLVFSSNPNYRYDDRIPKKEDFEETIELSVKNAIASGCKSIFIPLINSFAGKNKKTAKEAHLKMIKIIAERYPDMEFFFSGNYQGQNIRSLPQNLSKGGNCLDKKYKQTAICVCSNPHHIGGGFPAMKNAVDSTVDFLESRMKHSLNTKGLLTDEMKIDIKQRIFAKILERKGKADITTQDIQNIVGTALENNGITDRHTIALIKGIFDGADVNNNKTTKGHKPFCMDMLNHSTLGVALEENILADLASKDYKQCEQVVNFGNNEKSTSKNVYPYTKQVDNQRSKSFRTSDNIQSL